MRIVGLEEHFATPEVVAAWLALDPAAQDLAIPRSTGNDKERLLLDLADARIAAMDEVGVDMQVISLTAPGVQTIDPRQAVPLARAANDLLARTVRHRPDRPICPGRSQIISSATCGWRRAGCSASAICAGRAR